MSASSHASAPVTTDWFWTEISLLREQWDVLQHPFYQRWSAGKLDVADLQLYASEYYHAVVAIAEASKHAARHAAGELASEIEAHALEEIDHVELWMRFAHATGWCGGNAWYFGEDPYEETLACARVWAGGASRSLAGHLVALYAIESVQPQISEAKLTGLLTHYGFAAGSGTEYFQLHSEHDHAHARLVRGAFEQMSAGEAPFRLLHLVESVYRAYWGLLDRLEAECPSS